jgi:hypothetical protein
MRVAIMQPYFFPYVGYFALMRAADEWVVFDVTQYTPKSWMNRNRVLHPAGGWNYVTAAVFHAPRETLTRDIRVLDVDATRATLLGKITHYRRAAPHYAEVRQLIEDAFDRLRSDSLVDLNVRTMQAVCARVGIERQVHVASELPLDWSTVGHPGGWAPLIAAHLGATEYLNPIGGKALFQVEEFATANIALQFLDMPEVTYGTQGFEFVPNLSILDVLMWNSPGVVAKMLSGATIVDAHRVVR